MAIITTILKLLGVTGDHGPVNMVAGMANHLVMLPLITYLVTNAGKSIDFNASLGFLALIVGFIYVIIEVVRRSP